MTASAQTPGRLDLQRSLWTEAIRLPAVWARLSEQMIEVAYSTFLREGDQALDLGANAGRHTAPIARAVGASGKVVAVEPIPYMAKGLRTSLEKAGLHERVEIIQAAVGDQGGSLEFHVAVGQEALSSLSREVVVGRSAEKIESVVVQVLKVDEAFADRDFRFIKLDIEGAEFMALRGARQLLGRSRPLLAFEDGRGGSAKTFGYTMEAFYGFFAEIDYVVLDLFGYHVGMDNVTMQGPWNFFAVHREALPQSQDLIRYALDLTLLRQLKE